MSEDESHPCERPQQLRVIQNSTVRVLMVRAGQLGL